MYSCIKDSVMGPDSLYCSKWGNLLKGGSVFDLNPTISNIKLVINNVFKFHVPRSITF